MMTNSFWALVSLIIFCAVLVYYKVPAMLQYALSKRAERIKQELEEARGLREEAQQLLAEYQRKRFEAENEAVEIINAANRRAENIIADMRKQTENYIALRNKMAKQRIEQAEFDAERLIRSLVVDKAVVSVDSVLGERLKEDKTEGDRLFDRSLAGIEAQLKKAS